MTTANQAPPRIPLVTPLENRNTTTQTDPKMVNAYVEKASNGYFAVKRSGISFAIQATAGTGQGLVNFQNALYSVSGDYLGLNGSVTVGFTQQSNGAGFSARDGSAAVGFLGRLWVIGGTDGTNYFNDIYSSLDGKAWTLVTANAPWSARAYSQLVVFNDVMYLLGGSGATNYGDVWSTTDGYTWTLSSANAFPGRMQFGCVVHNNKLFVLGGRANQQDEFGNETGYYNDVWTSVDGVAWIQLNAGANWIPRCRFGCASFGGKLIVIGGEYPYTFQGAASDEWTSADGLTWTRSRSNPFGQAASGVFPRAALTSVGAEFWIPPYSTTLAGGGGAGASAFAFSIDQEDEGDGSGGGIGAVSVNVAGTGYTSAPTVTLSNAAGVKASAYTMLNSQGATGDKRGVCAISAGVLYFFGTMNSGSFSNDIWQSTDGTTWTLFSSTTPYSARDTTIIVYGNIWVFGGLDSAKYQNDVWSGALAPLNSTLLPVTTAGLPFHFAQTAISIASPLLFMKSTDNAFSYNPATTLLTTVDEHTTNFPGTTVPGLVYLDGFFFVMDVGGKIWNSTNLNDPTVWAATDFISAQSEPNGGAGIAKIDSYVVAFGQWSTTFFYNAALPSPGSPLAPNPTYTTIIGCPNGDSIVEMQDSIVWIGQSKKEGKAVYIMEQLHPKRISTPYVDRILQLDDLSGVRAISCEMAGHSCYVMTLLRSNITLVYDFQTGEWSIWTSRQPSTTTEIQSLSCDAYGLVTAVAASHGLVDGDPVTVAGANIAGYNGSTNAVVIDSNTFQYKVSSALGVTTGAAQLVRTSEGYFYCVASAQVNGIDYFQHESNGVIFKFTQESVADYGNPIDVRVVTASWDGEVRNKTKFLSAMNLLADNVSSYALLRYTDNDYKSWSAFRFIDLSASRPRTTRLGSFLRRAFQLRHTAATPFRAQYLELEVELGN